MDLGTIRQWLLEQLEAVVVGSSDDNDCNSNSFYSSFAHVHQDVRLVFNNCMYYHPENTYYYNVAETLRTHWDAGYQNFLNNLKSKETTSIVTEQEVTSTKTTPARQQRHHRRIQNFARALHRISAIDVGDILFEVETKCPGALQRTMQQEQQQDMVLSDSSSPATIQQHDSSTSDINSKCNSNASNTTQQQQQQQQMMIQLDVDYLTEAFLDEIEPVVEAALEGRNASSLQQRHNLEEETTVQKQDYVDDNTNDTDDDDDDDDDDDFIEPSVPTPPPSQVDPQQETALRREYSASTEQLPASEEKRNLCWKKAEFEIPHQHMDPNRYNTTMPALHFRTSTTSQNLPRQAAALPTVAVDTPAARPWYSLAPPPPHHHYQQQQPLAAGQIESKYSTARVRQRTASDGTVAPVSTPKKTKDGLYQRPAGRTRKEMEWDAVRGVWVPSRAHG